MAKFKIEVDEREVAAILAGLRCYQTLYHEGLPVGVDAIASNDGSFEELDPEEVDRL